MEQMKVQMNVCIYYLYILHMHTYIRVSVNYQVEIFLHKAFEVSVFVLKKIQRK